jgi:hypothetical protein
LNAKEGDLIHIERVSSWNFNQELPDAMYEGITSRLLILTNEDVKGIDVTDISFYKEEEEVLLAPCYLFVKRKISDALEVGYVNKVITDSSS